MDPWVLLRVHLENNMKWLVTHIRSLKQLYFYHHHQSAKLVSILHYPEPAELSKSSRSVCKKMAERSATSLKNSASRFSTPTQGIRSRNSGSRSGYTSSMHSGRTGMVASGSGDISKVPLSRHADEPIRSIGLSLQDSGKHSAITSSGSLEQSQERKAKKIRKSKI